jgi:hypothetical protein
VLRLALDEFLDDGLDCIGPALRLCRLLARGFLARVDALADELKRMGGLLAGFARPSLGYAPSVSRRRSPSKR